MKKYYLSVLRNRFEERYIPDPNTGCWLWIGSSNKAGYGQMSFKGKLVGAHRVSWELRRGPIPERLCVCHKCDTPACVNPAHLFLGTRQDNTDDRSIKGRKSGASGESHGHSKLTAAQVIEIFNDPRSGRAIAKSYGLYPSAISKIKNKLAWKCVLKDLTSTHQG